MRKAGRMLLGVVAGAVVIGATAWLCRRMYWITIREVLQLAELVGIMDPKGALGGQVAGFNYQRKPEWVYPVGQVLGELVAYGPAMVVALLVMERVLGSWTVSLCGKCGARLRGTDAARVGGTPTNPEEPGESVAPSNLRCGVCGGEF